MVDNMRDYKIVNTDNFGGDYPDEKFIDLPRMDKESCQLIANIVNESTGRDCSRFWKVVHKDYALIGGFEP